MSEAYLVLVGTIVGAIAAMGGNVLVTLLAGRAESRRQLLEIAFQAAKFDMENHLAIAKAAPPASIAPFAVYLHHSFEVARLIRDGSLSEEAFRALREEQTRLLDAAREATKKSS